MACVFCDGVGGDLLWQDALCRVVLPQEPGYPGFVRVIAQDHVAEMTDFSPAQRRRIMDVVWTVERVVRTVMQPHKVNIASLGNMVPHVHWHIIPRWQDDRHFPEPVWGNVHRDGEVQRPAVSDATLAAALAQLLPGTDE